MYLKLVFLMQCVVFSQSLFAKPLKVSIQAPVALVVNLDTESVLYEKNSQLKCYPASLTKVATALYILEKKANSLDEKVTASASALRIGPPSVRLTSECLAHLLEIGGSNIGIKPGEVLSARTLLYGLLLSSGNDAANVLAEWTSGSVTHFVEELNIFLKDKGICNTHFVNPHGLHHPDHWTTAYDLFLMTKLAWEHPLFRDIVKTIQYPREQTNRQPPQYLYQTNRLLRKGPYFYSKAIGIKTGYTSEAGYSLIAAATQNDRKLAVILLNCTDNQQRFREAVKICEAAFSEKMITRILFDKHDDRFTCPIKGSKKNLKAGLIEDLILQYYPSEEPAFHAQIVWKYISLPIKSGNQVGIIQLISTNKKILKEVPIYSLVDIEKQWWTNLKFISLDKRQLLRLFFCLILIISMTYLIKKKHKLI